MDRESTIWDGVARFFKADPDETDRNAFQQESYADADASREAKRLCQVLNRPRQHNQPSSDALRATWRGREAEYLYGRFGAAFGWRSHAEAESFYRKHK